MSIVCKFCGELLGNNDLAMGHAGKCEAMNQESPVFIDVKKMAQEVVDWRRRYNESVAEIEHLTGDKRFRVNVQTAEEVINSCIEEDDPEDE